MKLLLLLPLPFLPALLLNAPPTPPPSAPAPDTVVDVLDFEGLAPGTILDQVYGQGGLGPVEVFGYNPAFGPLTNAAVVFDSSNPTGEDPDLGTPNETCVPPGPGQGIDGQMGMPYENCGFQGNVLIVAEDLVDVAPADGLVDDPDDADLLGSSVIFDFSAIAPVSICSLTIIDVEADEPAATVDLTFLDGTTAHAVLPVVGDNGIATVGIPCGMIVDVVSVQVTLNGSGAIDDLTFSKCEVRPPTEDEGCTPGFWKNHTELWDQGSDPAAQGAGFTTAVSFNLFFGLTPAESGFPDGLTMDDAINLGGGGPFKLARHGTAALLNLGSGLSYQLPRGIGSQGALVQAIHDAYLNDQYEPLATQIADANEADCPF